MCGIAASLGFLNDAKRLNLELLNHRGPDSSGEWQSHGKKIWFGHTRLSILDLSPAGHQPMVDPSTGNCIVFNGEIYNHLELRAELNVKEWRGGSDTETLLVAYRFWGLSMIEKLRGMFAFLIYDSQKKQLVVARDRLGIKPLYYSKAGDEINFSSEIRLLLNEKNRSITKESFSAYLQYGACPESSLLIDGIYSFPASHYAIVSDSGEFSLIEYWKKKVVTLKQDTPSQNVRRLLEDSVKEHLLSDVPVASFLSGGVDSSVITALAARASAKKIQTFSVGFKQKKYDETKIAQMVADRYGTNHIEIVLEDNEIIGCVQQSVEKMDLPSSDAINTFIVSHYVSKAGIKVALSGLGSDELFGGYKIFKEIPRLKYLNVFPDVFKRLFLFFGKTGQRLSEIPNGSVEEIAFWRRRLWTNRMLLSLGLPLKNVNFDIHPEFEDNFSKVSWSELSGYMRHMLLRDSDQMSMANSLELRVPFLDHRLVSYVLGLPECEKNKFKFSKGLLIDAFKDLLPKEVYDRPKMGFELPMKEWMNGPLRDFTREGLDSVVEHSLLDQSGISSLMQDFERNKLHWNRIWSLVVAGHYIKKNKLVLN